MNWNLHYKTASASKLPDHHLHTSWIWSFHSHLNNEMLLSKLHATIVWIILHSVWRSTAITATKGLSAPQLSWDLRLIPAEVTAASSHCTSKHWHRCWRYSPARWFLSCAVLIKLNLPLTQCLELTKGHNTLFHSAGFQDPGLCVPDKSAFSLCPEALPEHHLCEQEIWS